MSGPDPGGQFASDAHRRVLCSVPNPDDDPKSVEELLDGRVADDDYLDVDDETELVSILEDLEADGHVTQSENGWTNTPEGFDLLTGPPKEGT